MAFSITVTARKLFSLAEAVTTGKLNLANLLTVAVSGAASTAQIENRAVTPAKAEMGAAWFEGTDAGTATAHAVTIGTALTDYVDGMMVFYRPNDNCNGSAITITITGDGGAFASSKALAWQTGFVPKKGDVKSSSYILARYSASSDTFQILSQMPTRTIQGGEFFGTSTADVWAIDPETDRFAWASLDEAAGKLLQLTAENDNTGAVTLNYLTTGAKAVRTPDDLALTAGQITAGMQLLLTYNAGFNSAAGAWVVLSPLKQPDTRIITSVRQTVLSGPVDASGHPVLLTYSGQDVTLKATADDPFLCVFAAGFDDSGAVDYELRLTADAASAWTIPTTDATYYLFVDRDTSTGAFTYGYTTSQPTYVDDDAAAITSGAHTFLKNQMRMYLGDGAAAGVKQRVFVGEGVVTSSVIASVTSYMFKGRFQNATDTAITSATGNQHFTFAHKLGLVPARVEWVAVCQSPQYNYAAGDEVPMAAFTSVTQAYHYNLTVRDAANCILKYLGVSQGAAYIANKDSGTFTMAAITAANWKVRCYAERGW